MFNSVSIPCKIMYVPFTNNHCALQGSERNDRKNVRIGRRERRRKGKEGKLESQKGRKIVMETEKEEGKK